MVQGGARFRVVAVAVVVCDIVESGVGVGAPQLLELVDLRDVAGACTQCLGVAGPLDKPLHELLLLHKRGPLGQVPVVLRRVHLGVAR
eukprot:scaffold39637_cov50-Phaeocystis_antarctica.AAC.1